jgi:hypothetical protein
MNKNLRRIEMKRLGVVEVCQVMRKKVIKFFKGGK